VHSYMQGSAQCVYAAYTHTVQTAGYFIGVFIELTAGVVLAVPALVAAGAVMFLQGHHSRLTKRA